MNAVGLQGEPARLRQVRRARDRPGRGVDRHHAIGGRDGDEEAVAVGGEHPIVTDAGERHEGQQPAPAESEPRVDHGDRGIVVEGDDVKLVQVELGRGERVAAGEPGDLAGQRAGVAWLALGPGGEPCGGPGAVDGPAGRGVGDPHAEGHVVADAQDAGRPEASIGTRSTSMAVPGAGRSAARSQGSAGDGREWRGVRGRSWRRLRGLPRPPAARKRRGEHEHREQSQPCLESGACVTSSGAIMVWSFSWVARGRIVNATQTTELQWGLRTSPGGMPTSSWAWISAPGMPTKTWACHTDRRSPPVV